MMLLPFDVAERRRATAPGTSLGAIADGLARELAPWLSVGLPIPTGKARLTRIGGRCPAHGSLLEFDPASPWAHRCASCHRLYEAREHHDWWVMGAHLFAAERVVHAAALYLLREDPAHRAVAVRTLRDLAARYAQWPNVDNVLGPSRPFFSTYLESIWLLNLCHALALLETAGVHDVSDEVRDRLLAPSSELVASFHEGRSNRQVWNEAAVLSAWRLLGRNEAVRHRLDHTPSIPWLLREGLLADGTWFEGDNYHQFAHRGLWYGLQLLDAMHYPLDEVLRARFREGFMVPFAGLLPDETFPSRRDSQYAVSLRQWRWAEWCELGLAYGGHPRLAGVLARLYDGTAPSGETGRAVSTADAERNGPPVALGRGACGWRALLMASASPAPAAPWAPGSLVQVPQGVAVLRRNAGQVYVALEGGASGGGHGHPDRLALTLQQGARRWLDDPGTGSYVDRTLHWYRSTLAHHAPLVNGRSQAPGAITLTAFEDRGGAGWMQKRVEGIAPGVNATRTVVVCDGYLVDVLDWEAADAVTLTLPVACGELTGTPTWQPATRPGGGGLEDGYDFLTAVEERVAAPADASSVVALAPASTTASPWVEHDEERPVRAWYDAGPGAVWWRAVAPGAPGQPSQRRLFVDVTASRGPIVGVWAWAAVTEVRPDAAAAAMATVVTGDGTVATHEFAPHGWHIGLVARNARSSIDLEWLSDGTTGSASAAVPSTAAGAAPTAPPDVAPRHDGSIVDLSTPATISWVLGASHYLRTEEPWGGENSPTATVRISRTDTELVVDVRAVTGHPPVTPIGDSAGHMPHNPLDNERADVNADGVQCYLAHPSSPAGQWHAAVLAVPIATGEARVTSLVANGPVPVVRAERFGDGWGLTLRWPLADLPGPDVHLDVVVNERPPARERRRGQLVLSGGGGFAYLRGDRHAPSAPLRVHLG